MKRKLSTLLIILFTILLSLNFCFAHSGRTDASGGHRDNRNVSGLGSYHYHCGGYPAHLHENGVCPYSSNSYTYTSNNNTIESSPMVSVLPKIIPVTDINVAEDTITLKINENKLIEASVLPSNASDTNITYTSNNDAIAIVNEATIKAISVGETTITLSAANSITKDIKVIVEPIPVESLYLNISSTTLNIGETNDTITTVISPINATEKLITWKSEDEKIATVDENGKITAVAAGNTKITATTTNGINKTIDVTVQNPSDSSGIGTLLIVGTVAGIGYKKYSKNKKDKNNTKDDSDNNIIKKI